MFCIPPHFIQFQVLVSSVHKAVFFARKVSSKYTLVSSGESLIDFPLKSETVLSDKHRPSSKVSAIISNLGPQKAYGHDCMAVIVVKKSSPELVLVLSKMYNKCIVASCFLLVEKPHLLFQTLRTRVCPYQIPAYWLSPNFSKLER